MDLDPEGVAVHAGARVLGRQMGQPAGAFEVEDVEDVFKIEKMNFRKSVVHLFF
jgi:hypothetical protein